MQQATRLVATTRQAIGEVHWYSAYIWAFLLISTTGVPTILRLIVQEGYRLISSKLGRNFPGRYTVSEIAGRISRLDSRKRTHQVESLILAQSEHWR